MMLALLFAAALAAPFAPPVDTPFHYKTVEMRVVRGGEAHATLHQELRFAAREGGYEAILIAGDHAADGPEPYRTLFDATLAPFTGVATRVRLDSSGAVTGAVGADATWAAVRAAEMAMLEKMDARSDWSAETKAATRARVLAAFDHTTPEQREARVSDSVALMLAPPLPALEVGETRAFAITQRTAMGPAPAKGTVTLVGADSATLRYRIETRTDPEATASAIAALLASLPPGSSDAQRQAIAALKDMRYVEQTELTVERATGLPLHTHTSRFAEGPDGKRGAIEWNDIAREP